MTTPRMLYIMGRGHSGSTFLDVMIGNVDGVESIGEVISGLNRGRNEICSCGLLAGDCPFWIAVAERYSTISGGRDLFDDGAWLWKQSDVLKFPQAVISGAHFGGVRWNEYSARQRCLIDAVGEVSTASSVLDSNKEYSRALMLLRIQPEARVIHLHRSPLAILGSHYYRRKEQGQPFKFLKREYAPERSYPFVLMLTASAWSVGMALGLLIKVMYPKQVLNLRYEKLMAEPSSELARIGGFLQIDLAEVQAMVAERRPFSVGHNLGGNELRHDGSFVFVPNVKGRRRLPLYLKVLAWPFALPGYLLRGLFAR
jgi:hypothetical protein